MYVCMYIGTLILKSLVQIYLDDQVLKLKQSSDLLYRRFLPSLSIVHQTLFLRIDQAALTHPPPSANRSQSQRYGGPLGLRATFRASILGIG